MTRWKDGKLLDVIGVKDSKYIAVNFKSDYKMFDGDYIFALKGSHGIASEFNFLVDNLKDFEIDGRFNSNINYEKLPKFKLKDHSDILGELAEKKVKKIIESQGIYIGKSQEGFHNEILNGFKYSAFDEAISRLAKNKIVLSENPPYKIKLSQDNRLIYLIDSGIQSNNQNGVGNIYLSKIIGTQEKKQVNSLEKETLIISPPMEGKIKWLSSFEISEKAKGNMYNGERVLDLDGYPAIMRFPNLKRQQKSL